MGRVKELLLGGEPETIAGIFVDDLGRPSVPRLTIVAARSERGYRTGWRAVCTLECGHVVTIPDSRYQPNGGKPVQRLGCLDCGQHLHDTVRLAQGMTFDGRRWHRPETRSR